MLAFQLPAWQQPPVLRDVPVPEPRAGEALLKMAGAGACHSDLHLMEWPAGQLPLRRGEIDGRAVVCPHG